MSEINENVQEETKTETQVDANVVIEAKPGKGRKILKWIVEGLVVIATGITGFVLGKNSGKDDDEDSAETEGPKDE